MVIRRLVAVVAGLAVALAGCARPSAPPEPAPLRPAWQPVALPTPAGIAGRTMVRDAATCAGHWYAVGGVADPAGEIRPVAWTNSAGLTWSPVQVAPSTFYGRRHLLYAVACRDGRMAALGAAIGGAHGNPRTGTWSQGSDGLLREAEGSFELFGGARAVSASRLAAGPDGWLVAGTRLAGAAVWTSPEGERFTLHEGLPELAGDGRGRTAAYDAVAVPSGWLVVGAVLAPAATPVAWSSADTRAWRRLAVPGADGPGQVERVTVAGDAVLAVGAVRGGFGTWRWVGSEWRWVGAFGSDGPGRRSVRALTADGDRVVAATADGDGHRLWCSTDGGASWRAVALPVTVPSGGDTGLAVAFQGDRLMVLADPGNGSRAWWARLSTDT
ncbi:hypothetical protein ACQPYA_22655 [Micromonospora sp. CA-263727]|uniref:hypothetical protein n=1 Tax=Micromonospora sp. CA-263727 TaxID=3239967 RepID=UPI003D8DBE46